jgi:hypothetical protein
LQQLRQLGDIRRNPPRLIAGEWPPPRRWNCLDNAAFWSQETTAGYMRLGEECSYVAQAEFCGSGEGTIRRLTGANQKDFQEQLEQASAKGQAEYMKMVTQLQEKAAEAMKMFERVQAANETAWKDMQTANQKAFAELQKGWAEALSRFE